MNGGDERATRLERLLHDSSLGRPGARQLRERASKSDVERVRRTVVVSSDYHVVAAMPRAGRGMATGPTNDHIYGRARELTEIHRALDETVAGAGGCIVLSGESGIGKSRLLRAAGAFADERGIAVAARGAFPRDMGMPLVTLAQALLSCSPPGDEFGWLSQWPSMDHHDTSILRIQDSLQRFAARWPLLIVIDDAHWMDELSALALDQLVPALAASPVRWLLTVNTTHSDPSPVLERLNRHGATPIQLTALDDHGNALLCTDLLAAQPDETVLAVTASSGGNPALTEQVLRALRDTGRISITGGVATVVGADPPTPLVEILAGVVRSRSDPAQQLVRAAAVLDQPFDMTVVARMIDCTPSELRDAIAETIAAGLLARSSRGLTFRHDLVRQAMHRTLGPVTTQRQRRGAAGVLTDHIATSGMPAGRNALTAGKGEKAATLPPAAQRADRFDMAMTTGPVGRTVRANPVGGSSEQAPGDGPTVLRIVLGAQLRRLREAKGITREDAGWEIRASGSKISRMELGRVSFKERDVVDLLTLYGVSEPDEREALVALARQGNNPGWWQQFSDVVPSWFQSYLGLEAGAMLIRTYEMQFVPGLLQTPDYARAVIMLGDAGMTPDEVDRRVELRRQRQQILDRPDAPQLWAVIDEAVLRRPIGGIDVMRAQIESLGKAAKKPNVRLQIVPFHAGGHAAAGGPFAILRFPEPELPDVVYVEQLTSAIYLDKREDVDQYAMAMDRCVIDAEPPGHTPEILGKLRYEVGRHA